MTDDPRETKGFAIASASDQIQRIDAHTYQVKSQNGNGAYSVVKNGSEWKCSCPDHIHRSVKCKHLWAVEYSRALREKVASRIVLAPIEIHACPICASEQIAKRGVRHNKNTDIQRYVCASCGKWFVINLGFERMKASLRTITSAMQLYFTGESLRNVQKFLRLQGVNVSHVAVYKWIRKYVTLMENYLTQIRPQISDTRRADEMFVKIKGNPKYLYALLDDETRYWIAKEVAGDKMSREAVDYASRLFQQGKEATGRKPLTLITDGLKAYHLAYKREFYTLKGPRTEHVTWEDNKADNLKMERFNGEIRDREKVMRGLKKVETPSIPGYQIYHNYVRPHEALDGKTPADACGIEVQGENKWLTLIQNASRHPTVNREMNHPRS